MTNIASSTRPAIGAGNANDRFTLANIAEKIQGALVIVCASGLSTRWHAHIYAKSQITIPSAWTINGLTTG